MPKNHHPEDVKAEVRKTGITLAELARQNKMAAVTGRRCLYEPCPRMNQVIADRLGRTVHDLWPEWFDRNNKRISRFHRENTSAAPALSCQKEAAA